MSASEAQKLQVKRMLVDQLHLRMEAEEIGDDTPLFGDEGLGLDSVDAIELVAGIEETFGLTFENEEQARKVLVDVNTLAERIAAEGKFA
ncbi:MAG: phosphopantetheine-binding protein [Planctomycetota bacterium]